MAMEGRGTMARNELTEDTSVCAHCGGTDWHHTIECFTGTDEPMLSRKSMTHADLDEKVHSLFAVGGIYELIAYDVERDNRPHCTGEPTGRKAPWLERS
jgi:hypothetical protein